VARGGKASESDRREGRPHVCFVAPYAYPLLADQAGVDRIGGAELQQVLIARGLLRRGYRVSMVCLDFGQEDGIEIGGVEVFKAHRPDAGLPVLRFFWPRLTAMWRGLARADADVYYQRTASMLTGIVAFFARARGRKSIFASASNLDLTRNTEKIRYRRDRWLYEAGLRRVDRILVQSERQAEQCRRNFGREPVVVPNAYDVPSDERSRTASRILWVSMIRSVKQPHLFLALARALPEHRFTMVGGAGEGEAELYEEIRSRAEGIANLDFEGFVPYREVGRYFDDAMLFVNTSESEGFPNTFLQAWARGVPTVSFVDCGARVDGRPPGRVVGSVEEMVSAVASLGSDPESRAAEGARCRTYVEQNHAPERIARLYDEIFAGASRASD
jgi:glycosyltransferase involved in cell wall biosynthesis